MPTYGPTNVFATQSGNVPVSQVDQNFTDAFLGINNAYLSGTFGSIPAPDGIGKGRYYYATDTQTLYRDNGAAWVQIAASAALTTGIAIATAGGTANALTATYTPALALSNNEACLLVAALANTSSAPTFSPNSLTAHAITKKGGLPLMAGDILPNCVLVLVYNLANTRWELANPMGGLSGNVPLFVQKWGALNLTQNVTRYALGISGTANATEGNAQFTIPARCSASKLFAVANAAIPGGQSLVITLRKNGAATALTCTMAAGATTASDTADSVTFEQGDLCSLQLVSSATMTSTIDFGFACLFTALTGDNAAGSAGIPFLVGSVAASAGTSYMGELTDSGTESLLQLPLSNCRVVSRGYSQLSGGAEAAGVVRFPTLHLTGSALNVGAPVVLADGAGVYNGSFFVEGGAIQEFAANDLVSVLSVPAVKTHTALRLATVTAGAYAPIPLCFSLNQAQALTRYAGSYGTPIIATNENEAQIPMPSACVLRNLRVSVDTTPAGVQTVTVTVRKNGVATALTAQCTNGGGRVAADTSNSVSFAAGDLLSVQVVSSATVGTRTGAIGVEVFAS